MNTHFQMKERFGSFLADGEVANAFRFTEVEPAIARGEHVVFELEGVTNMTDSFGNALFGTLFKNHPELLHKGVEFRSCSPLMRTLISAAIQFAKMAARRQQLA
jgi:hypothetical protein